MVPPSPSVGAEVHGDHRRLVRRGELRHVRPGVCAAAIWMWPNARISVMGGEQAARSLLEDDRGERRIAMQDEIRAKYEREGTRTTRRLVSGTTGSSIRSTVARVLALGISASPERADPGNGVQHVSYVVGPLSEAKRQRRELWQGRHGRRLGQRRRLDRQRRQGNRLLHGRQLHGRDVGERSVGRMAPSPRSAPSWCHSSCRPSRGFSAVWSSLDGGRERGRRRHDGPGGLGGRRDRAEPPAAARGRHAVDGHGHEGNAPDERGGSRSTQREAQRQLAQPRSGRKRSPRRRRCVVGTRSTSSSSSLRLRRARRSASRPPRRRRVQLLGDLGVGASLDFAEENHHALAGRQALDRAADLRAVGRQPRRARRPPPGRGRPPGPAHQIAIAAADDVARDRDEPARGFSGRSPRRIARKASRKAICVTSSASAGSRTSRKTRRRHRACGLGTAFRTRNPLSILCPSGLTISCMPKLTTSHAFCTASFPGEEHAYS